MSKDASYAILLDRKKWYLLVIKNARNTEWTSCKAFLKMGRKQTATDSKVVNALDC